jgi:flagellar hook protein FlgE
MTSYSASSNIQSISQDGQGIGAVTSINIQKDGKIYAALDNGQSAVIGTLGLVNFSNAEGLIRIGNNLLQQSPQSGEPIVGRPESGTFGAVQSGSLELSTVDIANEFVKLITLQRGFQANSKIITTINELLGAIIQLA